MHRDTSVPQRSPSGLSVSSGAAGRGSGSSIRSELSHFERNTPLALPLPLARDRPYPVTTYHNLGLSDQSFSFVLFCFKCNLESRKVPTHKVIPSPRESDQHDATPPRRIGSPSRGH